MRSRDATPSGRATSVNLGRQVMNGSVLDSGWPFGGLLRWTATHVDTALHSGVVTENDGRGRLLVQKPDGAIDAIEPDSATSVFGVDGYRLSLGELRIGDIVEVLREKRGSVFVTTEMYLLRRT